MFDFKIDKISNIQMLDTKTMEPIADFDGIGNVTVESEIETSSLAKEKICLNHEASFECELVNCSSLFNYATDPNDKPSYMEYYAPIWVQARWHKKPRINKKWLKRYGMKKDEVLVRCDVDSIALDDPHESYDNPHNLVKPETADFNISFSNMRFEFRPDQLRKNLKIEACCE